MERNETSRILQGMSEVELAFYAKFKLPHLSKKRKREVIELLTSKGLTKAKIELITSGKEFRESSGTNACLRCGSQKVYQHKTNTEKTKTHCLICGFVEGSKPKGLFRSLFGI